MSSAASKSILVTGATGFVASHLILQLLSRNYNVRTTIRDSSKESAVRRDLNAAGANNLDNLAFFVADLTKDEGWDAAVDGCDYVHHVASPFPNQAPKDENELLIPAKEGTLRVLQAAARANVKRVVFTSSFAAIGYGKQHKDKFDEGDWSDSEGLPVYHKSKLFAERAAWDFVNQQRDSSLELVVVNPVGIFGPVLGQKVSSSIGLIKTMLEGGMAACPRIYFNLVDVRDLANMHILAMTHPKAGGERFIASGDGAPMSLLDVANIVRGQRPEIAAKVPKRQLQDWMVKTIGLMSPQVRSLVPQLGQRRELSNLKAKRILGWKPRAVEDCLGDTVDSLAQQELI